MVRFGIVGAGGIANKFSRDINYVEDALITAVSARTKEQAEEYKLRYSTKYAFSSYEDMAKSDVIDAVYIATPHSFHYEHAILFMKNKKHVLIEKPIAVNHIQFEEMVRVAKENNVLMMEAMWTHFLPSTIFIQNMINEEGLGKLLSAKIDFGYSLIENYQIDKRLLNPNLAGGSILDIGVYPLAFYQLIKQVDIIDLKAKAEFTQSGVDAFCEIEITNANNAKIHLRSSIDRELPNNAELIYEKGVIKMIDFSRSKEVYINNTKYNIEFEGEGFVHEIRSFVNSIENNLFENPIMTHELSDSTIKLMDSIREIIGLKYPFE